jgi:ABC-type Fe3+-hydroxamate transport system substrate-binding protein
LKGSGVHALRALVTLALVSSLIPALHAGQSGPQRIVSLAPSVTEVLFEAGLGPRVVGVTSYCRFPREVLALPKVGGYLTPSYEALVALRPDLVVVLPEHADIEPRLAALNIPTLRVDHRNVEGIIQSIVTLGERCGAPANAARAADALRQTLARVREIAGTGSRPRVLVCFGRSEDFRRLYAAAPGTVHDDLITRAGGRNALTSGAVSYPTLSAEGVMRLDPDVIVEFAAGGRDADTLRRQWSALGALRAVKTGRVHVLTDDFLSVPGPRFVRLAETIARMLHPR